MGSFRRVAIRACAVVLALAPTSLPVARAAPSKPVLATRTTHKNSSTGPLVFCHFMVGITSDRTCAEDYDYDMQRAKSLGIDAFALNIGVDPYTDKQLQLAYQSAANNDMKVFLSFDFNWFNASQAAKIGHMIAQYGRKPAQLMVEGKIFASSFSGDQGDKVSVPAIRRAAGVDIFFAPNFHPDSTPDPSEIDGALSWGAWDSNGRNKAPDGYGHVTVADGDAAYQEWLADKPYVAPVAPWFNTHYGAEVSYSKNWVFPSDLLWFNRWTDILDKAPKMIEIITWNDYGECHYVGPLDSPHRDDGNSKWVNDMPHDGWLDMAKPFIAAYKDGAKSVDGHIQEDQLVYWYRPHLSSLDCDETDTTVGVKANNKSGNFFEGRPYGYETMEDSVFLVSLLTAPGSITVTSGQKKHTYNAPAGAFAKSVPMDVGTQAFRLSRQGATVLAGTSLRDVMDQCPCGIYNFNAYVDSLPSKKWKGLQADALMALTKGLRVQTCLPLPTIHHNATSADSGVGPTPAPAPLVTPGADMTSSSNRTAPLRTAAAPTDPSAAPAPAPDSSSASPGGEVETCNAGTHSPSVSGNFMGLCTFGCAHGYCPDSVCVCTSHGTPEVTPDDGVQGCPLSGEPGDGYKDLCAFTCARKYCPPQACTTSC